MADYFLQYKTNADNTMERSQCFGNIIAAVKK